MHAYMHAAQNKDAIITIKISQTWGNHPTPGVSVSIGTWENTTTALGCHY